MRPRSNRPGRQALIPTRWSRACDDERRASADTLAVPYACRREYSSRLGRPELWHFV